MAFPKTEKELLAAGYKFKNKARCRSCQANIEWWMTPNLKNIPLDAGTMEVHFTTCPNAAQHRKK
jgi:hypothetical protein